MIASTAKLLERHLNIPFDRGVIYLNRLVVTVAAASFVLTSTVIVAFDDIFPGESNVASLQIGDVTSENILAPQRGEYISEVLTEQQRENAMADVRETFNPPDPAIARQQSDLARQILNYINDVRNDSYASLEQKTQDIQHITALDLSELVISYIFEVDNTTWASIDTEIITVLERVMRSEIQESDLTRTRAQLPNQVSIRFNTRATNIIIEVTRDLIRPNTTLNEEATEAERQRVYDSVVDVTRSFEARQIVVPANSIIGAVEYEALEKLGLLKVTQSRTHSIARGLLASIIVMVVIGLYTARFRSTLLYHEPRLLTLLAATFLIVLIGAHFGLRGQFYIYPTATLGLLFVAIVGPEIAVIGIIGLAFLIGLMDNNSLETASLVAVGGLIGTLTLQRSERLNSFFFAGLMVAAANIAVVSLFNLNIPITEETTQLLTLLFYSFLNGILAAAATMAMLYIFTIVFNLLTALKIIELSQPSQPLLQRLLREAPGTYQHSLQVANLAEQAANAIKANAELTHVAALYHDIGKMKNPAFFTENQRDIGNPHDVLNDPYRSADIIIGHITEGDEMAKQYRLPQRIRDFIREHHGTSQVFVFYKQALILAGEDESMVDKSDFSYPGPKPQSRETGILMLADSCEAAVRSKQPKTKQEIEETVYSVIDGKRKSGQLDESGLTLGDIKSIFDIFVDMLSAIYHPRINYTDAIAKVRTKDTPIKATEKVIEAAKVSDPTPPPMKPIKKDSKPVATVPAIEPTSDDKDDEDTPMAEVPRLRRSSNQNGHGKESADKKSDTAETDKQ